MVDPAPAMARIVALLSGLPGVTHVHTVVPKSLDGNVNAYVTLGAWRSTHESGGVLRHDVEVSVTFGYRVSVAEAGTDALLAAQVGAFVAAYLPKLRNQLDGTVHSTDRPDFSINGEPEYALFAGQEYRLYRSRIPVVFRETF